MRKILVIFGDDICKSKGTSIRARYLVKYLSKKNKILLFTKNFENSGLKNKNISYIPLEEIPSYKYYFKTKNIVKNFNPDIIFSISFYSSLLGFFFSTFMNIKHVSDVHSFIGDDFIFLKNKSKYHPLTIFHILLGKFSYFFVDGFIIMTKDMEKKLKKKCLLAPGGIDMSFFNTNKNYLPIEKLKNKDKIIAMYAGNFYNYQGVNYLFESILKIGDNSSFQFFFIGDNSQFSSKEYLIIKNFKNVFFLGKKPYNLMPLILNSADILIVPRTNDKINYAAFPSKLCEYMAMKKPVIATEVGLIPDLITNNKTGILIKPNSSNEIINALHILENLDIRNKLSKNAYDFVNKNYSWQVLCEKIEFFFDIIIRK